MVRSIIPPRGFDLVEFNRRYAFEQMQKKRAARPVNGSAKGPRSRREATRHKRHDPTRRFAQFVHDLRELLSHKSVYRLENGAIVCGASFSNLKSGLRGGYSKSGIAWSVPSYFDQATDLFKVAGARVERGRHSRSYWGPDKWGSPCDVVFLPNQ